MEKKSRISIRLKLYTALRASRLFREECNRVHEERVRERDPAKKTSLGLLAEEHYESSQEFESELKRVDEGRDI